MDRCIVVGFLILFVAILIYFSIKYPSKVKEWLLYAVIEAEKWYGGGTGQVKLRAVYDSFLKEFPKLAFFVSFNMFSAWVDFALDRMREMLQDNKELKNYIQS